jgi:integrase
LASGYAGAFLPDLLAEKYKYAPKELAWQWFFPARTFQELLGHSNVRTTMIYTHTIKSQTTKEAKSPLDF